MVDVVYTDAEAQVTIECAAETISVVMPDPDPAVSINTTADDTVQIITEEADPVAVITQAEASTSVINSIETGPQGRPGPAGATVITYPASTAIGGHRIVVLNATEAVEYADHTTLTHANKIAGMSTGAAVEGADVTIQTHGEITEISWTWALDTPVWLSTTGLMTQTPPITGFSLIIGFPISATKLFIDIREPIFLS